MGVQHPAPFPSRSPPGCTRTVLSAPMSHSSGPALQVWDSPKEAEWEMQRAEDPHPHPHPHPPPTALLPMEPSARYSWPFVCFQDYKLTSCFTLAQEGSCSHSKNWRGAAKQSRWCRVPPLLPLLLSKSAPSAPRSVPPPGSFPWLKDNYRRSFLFILISSLR